VARENNDYLVQGATLGYCTTEIVPVLSEINNPFNEMAIGFNPKFQEIKEAVMVAKIRRSLKKFYRIPFVIISLIGGSMLQIWSVSDRAIN
jgi:hypothetical protein